MGNHITPYKRTTFNYIPPRPAEKPFIAKQAGEMLTEMLTDLLQEQALRPFRVITTVHFEE